jgi:predicted MFS family arabinose efflux permease
MKTVESDDPMSEAMTGIVPEDALLIETGDETHAHWGAVFSLSLSVVGFIIAELLPVSLLTPIAADLGVTDGMAGQAITTTSLMALFSSLFTATVTHRYDRRSVVLFFAVVLVASNLLVAFATNYVMFLAGRVLLGIGLGGFWSMAAAISTRLVPASMVPQALSIIFGGVSFGMVAAGPVGSFLGGIIGWRGIFLGAAVLAFGGFCWQYFVLPSIKPTGHAKLSTLFEILRRPHIGVGMAGMMLVFGGHFVFFTYVRPFLEVVTGVNGHGVSSMLLAFGIANIIGTSLAGGLVRKSLRYSLGFTPLLMAILATALVAGGTSLVLTAACVAGWGFAFGLIPVAWTTWGTRTVADEIESMGGLQVAAIQAAITAGAGFGGMLLDASGPHGAFIGSAIVLYLGAAIILLTLKAVPENGEAASYGH